MATTPTPTKSAPSNRTSPIASAIATVGQYLGLPEMGVSERVSDTAQQTRPSDASLAATAKSGGLLGNAGYVRSPVTGGTSVDNINAGKYTTGQYTGQPATNTPENKSNYNVETSQATSSSGVGLTHDQIIKMGLDENKLPPGYYRIDQAGGGGGDILGVDNARNIAKGLGLSDQEIAGLDMGKWAGESSSNADKVASEIEAAATENANREYEAIKGSLGVQKQEVQTLAGQQKGQLAKEKQFTSEGLADKQASETQTIEKNKTQFQQETEATKDELARNWRDLSLTAQRVMRSRGVANSAFASSQDAQLQMNFNKGLREIEVKSTQAYKDFADAVTETSKYYTREQAKLDMDYENALTGIDTWVRENVQNIQGQENIALSNKLSAVRSAVSQGNQLKLQTAQKIEDQKLAMATWVYQYQLQLKQAVATAAAGKVDDAYKNITAVKNAAGMVQAVLSNGGEFVSKMGKSGEKEYYVHGPVMNSDGSYDFVDLPITQGFYNTETTKTAASIARGTPGTFDTMTSGAPNFEDVYQNLYGNSNGNVPVVSAITSR